MPTTPIHGLPYPALADPADVPTDMGELALALDTLPGLTPSPTITYSTTPPASPANGDIWIYPAATGVTWQFRYRTAAPTYKWEFVGGPPYTVGGVTPEAVGTATTWVATPSSPVLTVPRTGQYLISMFNTWYGSAVAQPIYLGVFNQASTDVATIGLQWDPAAGSDSSSVFGPFQIGANASDVLTQKYFTGLPMTVGQRGRAVSLIPLAVN